MTGESEEDYVDEYLDKYDLYNMIYDNNVTKVLNVIESSTISSTKLMDIEYTSRYDSVDEMTTTTEQIPCDVEGLKVQGTESMKTKLYKIITKYSDCFHKTVGRNPAKVLPLILEVDDTKWKLNKNKCGPRIQSVIKE